MKLTPRERRERASATIAQSLWLILGCTAFLVLSTHAAQPSWWSSPGTGPQGAVVSQQVVTNSGVVTTNYVRNDYAAVTQGQLKQFTARAVDELNAELTGGAGTNLNTLVGNWALDYATNGYNATNLKPSDYNAMTVGQLKYVGNKVWSQLVAAGYTNAVPSWLGLNTNTDHAAANLGQLKSVFNFDLSDSDSNGLPDWWELKYFGHIGNDPSSSPDGNGQTLLWDYEEGDNPTNYYSQGGSVITPTLAIASGNNQTNTAGTFTTFPLVVKVTNSSGGADLANAPVTFAVTSGGGLLAGTSSDSPASTTSTITDYSGNAQVYYQQPSTNAMTSHICASTGGQSVTFNSYSSPGDGLFDSPTGLNVTSASLSELDLTWVNHASTATSIIVQQSTDHGSTWTTIATLSNVTTTSYAVTNLSPGVPYAFQIYDSK